MQQLVTHDGLLYGHVEDMKFRRQHNRRTENPERQRTGSLGMLEISRRHAEHAFEIARNCRRGNFARSRAESKQPDEASTQPHDPEGNTCEDDENRNHTRSEACGTWSLDGGRQKSRPGIARRDGHCNDLRGRLYRLPRLHQRQQQRCRECQVKSCQPESRIASSEQPHCKERRDDKQARLNPMSGYVTHQQQFSVHRRPRFFATSIAPRFPASHLL